VSIKTPQRKMATQEQEGRDLEKEMKTAGFRYSWSKMEMVAQDRAG